MMSNAGPFRRGARWTCIAAAGFFWLAVGTPDAFSQTTPGADQPARKLKIKKMTAANEAATGNAGAKSSSQSKPAPVKRSRRPSFEMDPNAKWVCEKPEVVLPPVWHGTKDLTFSFDIRNAGTADLKIRAKGGWGSKFNGRADRVIKPGETENLAVTIACHKLQGEFTRRVFVTTNDPEHPKETLLCKGKILEPVNMDPKLVNFGTVSRNAGSQQRKITLTRGDGGPLKPKLGSPPMENLAVSIKEIEPGEHYELEVTLNPPFADKRVVTNLDLETGVAEAPRVAVPVRMRIAPHVRAQPRTLRMPAVLEEDWERTIRLIWDDEVAHTILGATTDDPDIKLEIKEQDGEQIITARMVAKGEVPKRRRLITISTDDPVAPEVKVAVMVGRNRIRARNMRPGQRPGAQITADPRAKQNKSGDAKQPKSGPGGGDKKAKSID